MSREAAAPTLRERKQRATRERLLQAAQRLFAEHGYERTTMDDVAAEADVSRATAFNYFRRKEELVLAWVAGRRHVIETLLISEQSQSVDIVDRLRHVFETLCDSLEADRAGNRALVRAWVQAGGPLLPEAFATADLFADTLRHAQQQGQLRHDIGAEAAGLLLLDAYLGALVRWAAEDRRDTRSLSEELNAAVDITMNGLCPTTV